MVLGKAMCYLCETGALTTMREFATVHFQAMGEAVPVGNVAKEIDALCPTKIGHDVVYRLMQRPGFIGVWRKTEYEDSDIPYELELAYRLLRIHNSEVAAWSLVAGWWRKHGMNHDEAKANEVGRVPPNRRLRFDRPSRGAECDGTVGTSSAPGDARFSDCVTLFPAERKSYGAPGTNACDVSPLSRKYSGRYLRRGKLPGAGHRQRA